MSMFSFQLSKMEQNAPKIHIKLTSRLNYIIKIFSYGNFRTFSHVFLDYVTLRFSRAKHIYMIQKHNILHNFTGSHLSSTCSLCVCTMTRLGFWKLLKILVFSAPKYFPIRRCSPNFLVFELFILILFTVPRYRCHFSLWNWNFRVNSSHASKIFSTIRHLTFFTGVSMSLQTII